MIKKIAVCVTAFFVALTGMFVWVTSSASAATTTNHYISNLKGSTAPAGLGYNIFDTGTSVSAINALPSGVKALVWLGQKCPTAPDSTFKSNIDTLSSNPKVFGYYLSDEPHIADCPSGPANLKARVDYIKSKSSTQKTFIVLSKKEDFSPFRPGVTGVDMVGMDPYPCSTASPTCPVSKITARVNDALAAGIPRDTMVPVYQAFGQENFGGYYRLPTASQMKAMTDEYERLLPNPPMDYTYSWSNQPNSSDPTLVDSPELQNFFKEYFGGVVTPPTTTTTTVPTTTTSTTTVPTTTTTTTTQPANATRLDCPVVASPKAGDTITCTYR